MNEWQPKDWIAVVALCVAIVALFKDPIVAYLFGPRLQVVFDQANGADFHRITGYVRASGVLVGHIPMFYARVRVVNAGRSTAQMVELSVTELHRRDLSGTYVRDDTFLPLNLKWSHTGTTHRDRIPPTAMKYCDLLHIQQPAVPHSKPTMGAELDLEVQPSSGTGWLEPGLYKLIVQVAATNAGAKDVEMHLCVPPTWADDVAGMFHNGFYLTV